MDEKVRINSEWISLNAIREVLKIASKGDYRKSTYDIALEIGGELYPELLGEENSLLKRARQSPTAKEYIRKAELKSIKKGEVIEAVMLLKDDIVEIEELIKLDTDRRKNDQLNIRLKKLQKAEKELSKVRHTEHQLIVRDAYVFDRNCPVLMEGRAKKDIALPNENNLRIRILHPDKIEAITGADLIYEHHHRYTDEVSLVYIQYKIWHDRKLYMSDQRMKQQIEKLRSITCERGLCECQNQNDFRFPYCSSFLRPTDALQSANQKLLSTGEHLPICKINSVLEYGERGGERISYKSIKESSVSGLLFEELFNRGKIGSKKLSYKELKEFYERIELVQKDESVTIYAQEFNDDYYLI